MRKTLALLSVVAIAVPALGCAAGNTRRKYEQLTRDHDALRAEKLRIEGELMACRERCAILQEEHNEVPSAEVVPMPMPPGLEGKVDIRRRGNDTVGRCHKFLLQFGFEPFAAKGGV